MPFIPVLSKRARKRIKYLLRDEFTTDRAAGSVHGTAAEPGPGTRTVVDTDSKLSIGSGVLNLAPHSTPAWGDPSIQYLDIGVVRTAGRLVIGRINVVADTTYIFFSLNDAAGGAQANILYAIAMRASAVLRAEYLTGAGGQLLPVVGTYAAATNYDLCIVLRATGAYLFVKGGAFTNWTLLYSFAIDASTPLYATMSNYNAICIGDSIRIPDVLWLPAPVAYDTFTRANGALGTSETSGPDGQAVTGRTWIDNVGTWAIAGNVATCSVLAGGIGIATVDTATVSVLVGATLTRAGNEVGIILRYADADNYIRAVHDGTNCQLIKRVAAVETTVITAAVAIGAGEIVVISDGTSFSLFLNNVKMGATSTIGDAALQTGTRQGLFTTNVGNTMDVLSVFPRGLGNEYAALDAW